MRAKLFLMILLLSSPAEIVCRRTRLELKSKRMRSNVSDRHHGRLHGCRLQARSQSCAAVND